MPTGTCATVTDADAAVEQVADGCADTAGLALDTSRAQICGDFDFQVDYTLTSFPVSASQGRWTGVRIQTLGSGGSSGSTPGMTIERYSANYLSPTEYYKSYTSDSSDTASTLGSTSDTGGKLRITRTGAMMTSYYWQAATATWSMLRTESITTAPMLVVLYTATSEPTGETVSFDNAVFTPM